MAMQAPPEEHAYVVLLNADGNGRPDALAVMDVIPELFDLPAGRGQG